MSLQAAEHWLSLIRHQAKVTQHNFQCLLRQHKPMATHLRTMRREARSQAKERAQPITPHKAHSRAVQAAVKAMRQKLYAKRNKTSQNKNKRGQRNHASHPTIQSRPLLVSASTQQSISDQPTLRQLPP